MGVFTEVHYFGLLVWRNLFPRGDFKAEDVPDLTGQVLLQRNAKVYMASRSREKAEAAIAQLRDETGREAIFLELDLSSLASVRKAASEFLRRVSATEEAELHVLFNNAGVMGPPVNQITADGFDLQFGTNVVGHFLFTELLMPALFAGAQSSSDHHARVVTTSSSAAMCGHINFATIRDGPARRRYSKEALYAQSKLANVVVSREIAKRYGDQGIVSISVDPGSISTDLQRYYKQAPGIGGAMTRALAPVFLRPASVGALTQLWAGTTPEAIHENGKYAIPVARIAPCRPEAYDDMLGQELWEYLVENVKEA
ncbi:NAD-binding protein [Fomitopsis schrenkii]|uniref:NAD-binding protein n=1 Tax=Fomitopsis schrenkii TaxID=2126942 RepID=S8DU23_FOMSC|nr:NAD-binding protein [Fomitopsis schrenkii]